MSTESSVRVVTVDSVTKHPDADTLDICLVDGGGYPVISRLGTFSAGDLCIFVPPDTVVPTTRPEFAFLDSKGDGKPHRVRAKRLRGVFSFGMLLPIEPDMSLGDDVTERLGCEKYDEDAHIKSSLGRGGDEDAGPTPNIAIAPSKYDIEPYRKYGRTFEEMKNDTFMITEKLHGASIRFVIDRDGAFRVGSRNRWLKTDSTSVFARAAERHEVARKMSVLAKHRPGLVLFGELLGVQDLRYGCSQESPGLAMFDAFDSETGRWLNPNDTYSICISIGLEYVPILYSGPLLPTSDIYALAEGKSCYADHVREGVVIRPIDNQPRRNIGSNCVLKLHGEGYLTRKTK